MASNTEWQVSDDAAEAYERTLVPVVFVPWGEELLRRAGLRPGETVLDVACGTGIVARMASAAVGGSGQVAGVDINPGMLAVARRIAPDIGWVEAPADALPLPDASCDAVFCQQGFQFFPDKPAAAAEIRRVLKPGGRAVLCVAAALDENPLMMTQVETVTRYAGADAAKAIRAVCGLPDGAELEKLFREADFAEVEVEKVSLTLRHPKGAEFARNLLAATPLAGMIAAMEPADQEAVAAEFLAGFGDGYDGKALAFPHVSNVVVARA